MKALGEFYKLASSPKMCEKCQNLKKMILVYPSLTIYTAMVQDTLKLVLKTAPFNVMETGEKKFEYRDNSDYWKKRIFNKDGTVKDFKYVEFSLGYQKNRRQFMAEFKGVEVIDSVNETYSNGFKVDYPYKKEGYLKIGLGEVLKQEEVKEEEFKCGEELRKHLVKQVFTPEVVETLQREVIDIRTIIDPNKLR